MAAAAASPLHGRWRRTLQRDEREHHRVWLRPDSCSDLTVLPYFTLATTLGLLLQREETELDLLLARAPRAAHVQRDRSIDRENQGEERRKTCLSCCSHTSFTPHDNVERARAAVLREVEQLELDVRARASFSYAQERACCGPSEGRKMAPLAMLEVGDRVESRAHSFGSREPQGGRNLVGGA